jgi:multiple sugar transport system substrate-binding protein
MTGSQRFRAWFSRRSLLHASVLAGIGIAPGIAHARQALAAKRLTVLTPLPPNPAPPGVALYASEAFSAWKSKNGVDVQYDPIDWPQLYRRMATYFESDSRIYDVVYTAGWIPEFHQKLEPIGESIAQGLKADMPGSSFNCSSWEGEVYGYPSTLSLLTLFFNAEHLQRAGLSAPPATWDELKAHAKELTRDGRVGWVANYGMPNGIGGTASYWMALLQQAGGSMYDQDGLPIFNDVPGVEALQLMIELMPFTHPSAARNEGIVDATNVFIAGEASMMMNWPFMWQAFQQAGISSVAGSVGTAVLPAGPAGTASIDGADSWSVTGNSRNADLARTLIEFYLDKKVQRQQAIETGWLPIRLSVLKEAAVQEALPHAATLLEQAQHPYDSFLTPDYDEVTLAIGTEIQRALLGEQSAAEALSVASDAVTEIVKRRR